MAKFYCPTKLSENISKTPEGYLLCVGVPIARTGVMEYGAGETPLEAGDDGIVYVSRDADEVFSKITMASFEGKPITIKHPDEFVTPANWKELAKGTIQNVRRAEEEDENGEEILLADLLITEAFAISLVEAGLREVSCGYEAEYEQTSPGEGRQLNIVGNHLALVDEGRAGSSYAIHDHKGKVAMGKKIGERLKDLLSKVVDEAVSEDEKAAAAAAKKKTKIKDEGGGQKASGTGGAETTCMDEDAYDSMKSAYDALGKQLDAMKPKSKDEPEEESEDEPEEKEEPKKKKPESKDEPEEESEDEGEDTEILSRLKALEAAVTKLLESKDASKEEEESEDESEEEESEDESEEGEEESEDEDLKGEESKKTGDAARAEILVPGFKAPKKGDMKEAALREALKDEETKAVILSINGGKKVTFDSKEKINTLFVAASEILKLQRGNGLQKTKEADSKPITLDGFDTTNDEMTPEKMNAINAAHWARK